MAMCHQMAVSPNSVKIPKHQFNEDPFFGRSVVQSVQLGGRSVHMSSYTAA
jgi:hypothetical protein